MECTPYTPTTNGSVCVTEAPKLTTRDASLMILDKAVTCHRELNDILNFIDSSFGGYTEPGNCETGCLSDCLEKTNLEISNILEAIYHVKNMLGI